MTGPVRIVRPGPGTVAFRILDADVQPHVIMDSTPDVNRLIVAVMRARIHGMHGPLEYRATAKAIGEIEAALLTRESVTVRRVPFVHDESVPWVDLCERKQPREQEAA